MYIYPFLPDSSTSFSSMVLVRGEMEMTPKRRLSATPHKKSGNRHPAICKLTAVYKATALRTAQRSTAIVRRRAGTLRCQVTSTRTKIRRSGEKSNALSPFLLPFCPPFSLAPHLIPSHPMRGLNQSAQTRMPSVLPPRGPTNYGREM